MKQVQTIAQNARVQLMVGALALCILLSKTYWLLMSQAGPVGIDGYYYVLQVSTLIRTGHLYFATATPLVFYLQGAFAFVFGNVPLAIKMATLSAVAVLFPVMLKSVKVEGESWWPSILSASAVCLASPFLYFEVEFLKNLFGLLFLFICYSQVAEYLRTGKTRQGFYAFLSMILASFSHKSTAALSLIFLLYFVAFEISESHKRLACIRGHLFRNRRVVALSLTILVAGVAILNLPDRSSPFRFVSYLGGKDPSLLAMPFIMIVTATAALFLSDEAVNGQMSRVEGFRRGFVILFSGLILSVCFLAYLNLGVGLDDLVDRTSLTLFPFMSILAPSLVRTDGPGYARALRSATLILFVPLFYPSRPAGVAVSKNYELITAEAIKVRAQVPKDEVVIAPHGVDFLLAAKYGLKATPLAPQNKQTNPLHFAWKTSYMERIIDRCGYHHVDLGGGALFSEEVLEKIALLKMTTNGSEPLTCPPL